MHHERRRARARGAPPAGMPAGLRPSGPSAASGRRPSPAGAGEARRHPGDRLEVAAAALGHPLEVAAEEGGVGLEHLGPGPGAAQGLQGLDVGPHLLVDELGDQPAELAHRLAPARGRGPPPLAPARGPPPPPPPPAPPAARSAARAPPRTTVSATSAVLSTARLSPSR